MGMIVVLGLLGILGQAACSLSGEKYSYEELFEIPIQTASSNYSCKHIEGKQLNDFHIRGTSLGGWMVLEPWITPSLFYQFLGATEKWGDKAAERVAIDSITFCTALGKKEANRQLRNHWKTWVTEQQISNLAQIGVHHIRIPVGDWMYVPYEPYIGCWDGALEEVDRVLALCKKYDIDVIMDIHGVRHSQNGLDNSGDTGIYEWHKRPANGTTPAALTYQHWDYHGGTWAGHWNWTTQTFDSINSTNFINTLKVVDVIVDMYRDNDVVIGITPVNEPSKHIPFNILKEFYWRTYRIVQHKAPHWITMMHDSFRLTREHFGPDTGFMTNCDLYAIDTHIYHAWAWKNTIEWYHVQTCNDRGNLALMKSLGVPVVVGEWSVATDNCAMWLSGFNDNGVGYPKYECERVACPDPYTNLTPGYKQPGAPPDKSLPAQDPFGESGESYVEYSTCPIDSPWPNDNEVMRTLSYAKLHAFDLHTHGQFYWNFRTELEPRWDYQKAVAKGWFPVDWSTPEVVYEIANVCDVIYAKAAATAAAQDTNSTVPAAVVVDQDTVLFVIHLVNGLFGLLTAVAIVGTLYFCVYDRVPYSLFDALRCGGSRTTAVYQPIRESGVAMTNTTPYQPAVIVNH